ncbi:YjgH family protein [Penicillium angulare]|uniref:YjgH family protein n=1 Tax=Penicillium angulare TaxID=116970 RepID=UPI00254200C5|nr:YjgH family protein [Penicillium angulare]KAJ5279494.1 YjgH family protein [Penicillium angulare]
MASKSIPTPTPSTKKFYATNSPWEAAYGYYRAVRVGQQIYVSGTTAADPESPPESPRMLFPGDARGQTQVTLKEVIKAIQSLGGKGAESIIRTQLFIQRHEDAPAVMQGFKDILGRQLGGDIGSTAILLVVSNFADPEMLVEIMVDAIADAS